MTKKYQFAVENGMREWNESSNSVRNFALGLHAHVERGVVISPSESFPTSHFVLKGCSFVYRER